MKKLLTGLVLIPVALIGCSGQKPEKERFASATKEITCLVLKASDLFDPALEQKSKDIFKNYGFNPDDDKQIQGLTDKYQKDPDVKAAVESAVKECGGDITQKLKDANGGKAVTPATPATPANPAAPSSAEEKAEPKAEAKSETTPATPAKPAAPETPSASTPSTY